jgi:outer membrane protein TolC
MFIRHYPLTMSMEKVHLRRSRTQTVCIYFLLLNLLTCLSAASQDIPSFRTPTFFDSSDRVLPVLIEAAQSFSPEVKELNAQKDIAGVDYELSKKEMLRNLSLNSSYNYGNYNSYFPSDAGGIPLWYSNHSQSVYSVGAGLSINMEQLLGGNKLRKEKEQLNITRADAQLQTIRNHVRQQVITQFQALKLARVVYLQRQQSLQSLFVNKELVDKKFREGSAKIADQLEAEKGYNDAYLATEEAKNAYQTQVLLLEELVGMPITPLLSKYFKNL